MKYVPFFPGSSFFNFSPKRSVFDGEKGAISRNSDPLEGSGSYQIYLGYINDFPAHWAVYTAPRRPGQRPFSFLLWWRLLDKETGVFTQKMDDFCVDVLFRWVFSWVAVWWWLKKPGPIFINKTGQFWKRNMSKVWWEVLFSSDSGRKRSE